MDIRILTTAAIEAKTQSQNLISTSFNGHDDNNNGHWYFWATLDENAPQFQASNCLKCGNYTHTHTHCHISVRCNCLHRRYARHLYR
jgi:hypothetical protein